MRSMVERGGAEIDYLPLSSRSPSVIARLDRAIQYFRIASETHRRCGYWMPRFARP